jgi:hypothetical protein
VKQGKKPTDDLELIVDGPLPVLIPDALYEATVTNVQKGSRYGRRMLDFTFRLVSDPFSETELQGFAVVDGNGAISPNSKICRWWMVIAQFEQFARRDRIAIRNFKGLLFQVQTETVTRDHQQRPLPKERYHSVVREIVAVVGRIKTT